jgi:hypothetical protein
LLSRPEADVNPGPPDSEAEKGIALVELIFLSLFFPLLPTHSFESFHSFFRTAQSPDQQNIFFVFFAQLFFSSTRCPVFQIPFFSPEGFAARSFHFPESGSVSGYLVAHRSCASALHTILLSRMGDVAQMRMSS